MAVALVVASGPSGAKWAKLWERLGRPALYGVNGVPQDALLRGICEYAVCTESECVEAYEDQPLKPGGLWIVSSAKAKYYSEPCIAYDESAYWQQGGISIGGSTIAALEHATAHYSEVHSIGIDLCYKDERRYWHSDHMDSSGVQEWHGVRTRWEWAWRAVKLNQWRQGKQWIDHSAGLLDILATPRIPAGL